METIDLFLKACDKVIQLLSIRADRKKRFFDEVIAPLFQQAEVAIRDYYAFLDACIEELGEEQVSGAVAKKLAGLRSQMKLARSAVCETARAIAAMPNATADLKEFAEGIEGVFYSGYVPKSGIPSEHARSHGVNLYDSRDPELLARVTAPDSPRYSDFPYEPADIRSLRGTSDPAEICYSEGRSNVAALVDLFQLAAAGKVSTSMLRVHLLEAKLSVEFFWANACSAYAKIKLRTAVR